MVQGIERFCIEQWLDPTPYLRARIVVAPDVVESDTETEALQRSLRDLTHDVLELSPQVPKEVRDFLMQVQDPRYTRAEVRWRLVRCQFTPFQPSQPMNPLQYAVRAVGAS